MTLVLPWWIFPIVSFATGIAGAVVFGRSKGDYDFASAFIGLTWVVGGTLLALGLLLGHWMG